MKYTKTYTLLMIVSLLMCHILPLHAAADESDDYFLGDAWSVDQEEAHDISMISAGQDEKQQIFYITGVGYYQKTYDALEILNQKRTAEGLDPLNMDEGLIEAAMQRAAECSVFYGHTRPNGLACSTIAPNIDAENIAASRGMLFSTADAVMDAWMNSVGHRQNIMNSDYQSIGIGCFYKDGVWYWSQEFSREKADSPSPQADCTRTYGVQALNNYIDPFFVVENHNMEKGQQIQYQIKFYNRGWSSATGYIDQSSYQWFSNSPQIAVDQTGTVFAKGWGSGMITAVNQGCRECCLTGRIDVHTDAVIEMAGELFIQQSNREGLVAGMPVSLSKSTDVEYSWYVAVEDGWACIRDWTDNDEWISWTPDHYGDFSVAGQARVTGNPVSMAMRITAYCYHPQIVGKCQIPYTGEGGGYLIGVESYENPGQKYQYEILILDCTLLAKDMDAWIYSTGRCQVSQGNALWTIWQPQYGYYWTLFRIYDEQGSLIDEACYGFQNI